MRLHTLLHIEKKTCASEATYYFDQRFEADNAREITVRLLHSDASVVPTCWDKEVVCKNYASPDFLRALVVRGLINRVMGKLFSKRKTPRYDRYITWWLRSLKFLTEEKSEEGGKTCGYEWDVVDLWWHAELQIYTYSTRSILAWWLSALYTAQCALDFEESASYCDPIPRKASWG